MSEFTRKERNIAWFCLILSGLNEIIWAYFVKLSHGFTILLPSVLAIFIIVISFFLLERAVRTFGIGMSYAVFTGIGIAGTCIIGILLLNETVSFFKIVSLIILLTGIIGLKLCDGKEADEK